MNLGTCRFHCTLQDNALLPEYKGSTFRGAFGGALKRVVCAVRTKECSCCMLAQRCVYATTFETTASAPGNSRRQAAPPHPYVIEPPLTEESRFAAGAPFEFNLLLFGQANDALPYFVYAFQGMGDQGIGKKIGERRSRFQVMDVICDGESIFDAAQSQLKPAMTREISLSAASESPVSSISLKLQTPLRLKLDNHLQAALPFHLLVRAMLRRISSLFAEFGNGEPDLDYRGLVARAASVKVVSSSLSWHDWERYSQRQDQAMLMGGMVGSVTYQGNLNEYLPLLELCRTLHIGKQTSFGLGMFDYTVDTTT